MTFTVVITRWRDPRFGRFGRAWEHGFRIEAPDMNAAVIEARRRAALIRGK